MSTDSSLSDDEFTSNTPFEKQQLLKSLHYTVGKICQDVEHNHQEQETKLNSSVTSPSRQENSGRRNKDREEKSPRMSKTAISCLTEMTFHYVSECLGPDLIAFSRHGNRKTITFDDVKLVARKNPGGDLLESLESVRDNQQNQNKNAASSTNHHNKNDMTNNSRKRNDFDAMGLTQQRDRLLNESSDDEEEFSDDFNNHSSFSRKRKNHKSPLKKTASARREAHVSMANKRSRSSSGSRDSTNDSQSDDTDDLSLKLRFRRNESALNTDKSKSKIVIESSSSDESSILDSFNKGASSQSRNSNIVQQKNNTRGSKNSGFSPNEAIEL